jgi:hypothetical protein
VSHGAAGALPQGARKTCVAAVQQAATSVQHALVSPQATAATSRCCATPCTQTQAPARASVAQAGSYGEYDYYGAAATSPDDASEEYDGYAGRPGGRGAHKPQACATLGAACASNRDCCHDFLCTRDPAGGGGGSYGYGDRRCECVCAARVWRARARPASCGAQCPACSVSECT